MRAPEDGIVSGMQPVFALLLIAVMVGAGLVGYRCRRTWRAVEAAIASESAAAFVARQRALGSRLVHDESGLGFLETYFLAAFGGISLLCSVQGLIALAAVSVLLSVLVGVGGLTLVVGGAVALKQASRRRLARTEAALVKARHEAWASELEPGVEGPVEPENGYEILVPVKRRELVDGQVRIRFTASRYGFKGNWRELAAEVDVETGQTPLKASPALVHHADPGHATTQSWPATTDIPELAAKWFEFSERVRQHNRDQWSELEQERQAKAARQQELAEQYAVAELLPGGTTVDDASIRELASAVRAR